MPHVSEIRKRFCHLIIFGNQSAMTGNTIVILEGEDYGLETGINTDHQPPGHRAK